MMLFSPYIPPIMYYQSVTDMKDVISTNDATIQGILLGVIIAIGAAFIYLYHQKNKLQDKYNKDLADVHTNYQKIIKGMHEDHKAEAKALNDALYAKMEEFSDAIIAMNKNYEQQSSMNATIMKQISRK